MASIGKSSALCTRIRVLRGGSCKRSAPLLRINCCVNSPGVKNGQRTMGASLSCELEKKMWSWRGHNIAYRVIDRLRPELAVEKIFCVKNFSFRRKKHTNMSSERALLQFR